MAAKWELNYASHTLNLLVMEVFHSVPAGTLFDFLLPEIAPPRVFLQERFSCFKSPQCREDSAAFVWTEKQYGGATFLQEHISIF
jgi:hypothetical protein